ncbi:MAG TPA: SDR family NAD(P)-dependent oxidoreductase [Candidatus Paceibacterota bacterium]
MDICLSGKRILITGVGIKPVNFIFKDITTGKPSHTAVSVDGKEHKANIGAAIAFACAEAGAIVHMVARTEDKLRGVKRWIERLNPGARVEYGAVDLNKTAAIQKLVGALHDDIPLYWVQSVGLGGGTVKVKNDNPYLPIEDISEDLVEAELSVLKNTIRLLQALLPRFRNQEETRVCVVSSMSAIRSVISGSIHMAAKGAIGRFANAATIELAKEKIFITDVRPGAVDTGMYDSTAVRKTLEKIATTYGYDWSKKAGGTRLMPPSAVGNIVAGILASEAHVTSVNLVARGQFPHEGS